MYKPNTNLCKTKVRNAMVFSEINPYVRYARYISVNEKSDFVEVIPLDARLFFTLNGCGKIKVQDTEYDMQQHSLLVVDSGVPYQIKNGSGPAEYIVLNFDYTQRAANLITPIAPVLPEQFHKEMLVDPEPHIFSDVLYIKELGTVQKYLSEIMREWTEKVLYYENKIGHILAQCLAECMRFVELGRIDREKNVVNQILSYVHNHYQENLTNISLSKQFGFHPNYISYAIKRVTRKPLHQYIIEVRLMHATELLENTTLSMTEIAAKCGFCDGAYFSQCFKKHFGVSPSGYRGGYYL